MCVIFLFGLRVSQVWTHFDLVVGLHAILSLTVVRMVPVALALEGTGLSRPRPVSGRPGSRVSGAHGAEPGCQGQRVKMKAPVEVAGHRFPVDVDDKVTVVRHAQRGLGLLVGQEPDAR